MIKEAIILAGGLGTRLRSVVTDLPKCMAPVCGRPFLDHVMQYLKGQGIRKMILSVGYRHEVIRSFVESYPPSDIGYEFSVETELLGTGGAIRLSLAHVTDENVIIVNGDTLFRADLHALSYLHHHQQNECTVSLKPMQEFDRYGAVELNDDHTILSFREKQFIKNGLINGGVYALQKSPFMKSTLPGVFSFEKDYLEKFTGKKNFVGHIQDAYFIDIGIPEDYERAQKELC